MSVIKDILLENGLTAYVQLAQNSFQVESDVYLSFDGRDTQYTVRMSKPELRKYIDILEEAYAKDSAQSLKRRAKNDKS